MPKTEWHYSINSTISMTDLGKTKIGAADQESSVKHSQKNQMLSKVACFYFSKGLAKNRLTIFTYGYCFLWQMWGKPTLEL